MLYRATHHRLLLLAALLAAGALAGCHRAKPEPLDVQKVVRQLRVPLHQASLYPGLLVPFLDESNAEEKALKAFLRTLHHIHIYYLPQHSALDSLAKHAKAAGYTMLLCVRQNDYAMTVYGAKKQMQDDAQPMVVLLSDFSKNYYCIEMCGNINRQTLLRLGSISPTFFDTYIQRFNFRF
jgi:hypothetical protein